MTRAKDIGRCGRLSGLIALLAIGGVQARAGSEPRSDGSRIVTADARDVPVPLTPLQEDRRLAELARRKTVTMPSGRLGGSVGDAPATDRFTPPGRH